MGAGETRADRIASAIEVLRVAALSSYENRPISSGVLILGSEGDPWRPSGRRSSPAVQYSQSLTGVKSFFRLVDGLRTLFLVGRDGRLLDIVDVRQWASVAVGNAVLPAPCPVSPTRRTRARRCSAGTCAWC